MFLFEMVLKNLLHIRIRGIHMLFPARYVLRLLSQDFPRLGRPLPQLHLVLPHLIPLQRCGQARDEQQGSAAGKQRQGKAAAAEQMPGLQ